MHACFESFTSNVSNLGMRTHEARAKFKVHLNSAISFIGSDNRRRDCVIEPRLKLLSNANLNQQLARVELTNEV